MTVLFSFRSGNSGNYKGNFKVSELMLKKSEAGGNTVKKNLAANLESPFSMKIRVRSMSGLRVIRLGC